MKKSNKVISLEYLQNLVKKQEEKEEREKGIGLINIATNEPTTRYAIGSSPLSGVPPMNGRRPAVV